MSSQGTSYLGRSLQTDIEVSNKEDWGDRRHRKGILINSPTTKRERCHQISMAQRCEPVAHRRKHHYL